MAKKNVKTTEVNETKAKKNKSIANCTPREFAEQLAKITDILQPYADKLKAAVPKFQSLKTAKEIL